MRKFVLSALAVAAFAAPSFAALAPGQVLYNPQLNGTGEIGAGGPFYTSGAPAWLGGPLLASLVAPIAGIPGFLQFQGTVTSRVAQVSPGVLGFAYQIQLNAQSAPNLVRAALNPIGWNGVNILDTGADGSGVSTNASGNTVWNDGDPYFIERAATPEENPQWQFRLGSDGTQINKSNRSAWVWFEVQAQSWDDSTISLLDGGAAGASRVLTIVIPSPAAAGLGMLGLALVGALRRR